MSNFMPLRQLITDLINTLLLAILTLTAGRAPLFLYGCAWLLWKVRRGHSVSLCLCDRGASESGCQHVHPSQQRPRLIDIEYVFHAINQELRLKMTRLEACGPAVSREAIVIIVFLVKRRVSRPPSPDEYRWKQSCYVYPFFFFFFPDHFHNTWDLLVFFFFFFLVRFCSFLKPVFWMLQKFC